MLLTEVRLVLKFKRIYKILLITLLSISVLSQILLLNDNTKTVLSQVYDIESKYVFSQSSQPVGTIKISVSNPSDNLSLLQNGEKIAVLNQKTAEIEVSDNSVIEIDGTAFKSKSLIKIDVLSDSLQGYYEKEVQVCGNIVILGRFFVK